MSRDDPYDTPAPGDETGEETEPSQTLEDETPGIKGQIVYPDPTVDAERAGAFAAGKADSLDPEHEDESGWQNPADRSGEVPDSEETEEDETR